MTTTAAARTAARTTVEALGLDYWSDGPVAGTSWARDAFGRSVLVGNAGEVIRAACPCGSDVVGRGRCSYCGADVAGTPAQRAAVKRASELEAAMRDPRHAVAYDDYGRAVGIRTAEQLVPFDRAAAVKNYPAARAA